MQNKQIKIVKIGDKVAFDHPFYEWRIVGTFIGFDESGRYYKIFDGTATHCMGVEYLRLLNFRVVRISEESSSGEIYFAA